MPDRNYTLVYDAESARAAAAAIDQLIARVTQLDKLCDQVAPKFKGLFSGSSRGVNSTGKAVQGLTANLAGLQAQAGKTAPAVQSVGAAVKTAGAQLRTAGTQANTAGTSLAGFTGRIIALQAARATFNTVVDETKKLEEYWQRLAKEATAFRDSLRELANIQGKPGPDNQVAAGVLDAALAARMTADKAKAFVQAYENVGPTVRQKGHYDPTAPGQTKEDLEKAVVAEAARTATRMQVDPKAAGAAIGAVGMFHKIGSVEESQEQLAGALQGISEGKLENTPGITALTKGAAVLMSAEAAAADAEGKARPGRLRSFAEGGVMLGVTSLFSGGAEEAKTNMVHISRAMNSYDEEAQKALASMGVTPAMSDPEKLVQLGKGLKAAGVKDPMAWMREHKVGGTSNVRRERTAAALKLTDVLEQRLTRLSESKGAIGRASIAANARVMRTDQASQAAGVAAVSDVMDKALGMKNEEFETAKEAAEQRLRAKVPGYKSPWMGVTQAFLSTITYPAGGVGGQGAMQEGHHRFGAIPTLRAAAKATGVDLEKVAPGLESLNYETRATAFGRGAAAVRAAGGDPLDLKALERLAQQQVDELRKLTGRPAGPAPPAVNRNPALPADGGNFGPRRQ